MYGTDAGHAVVLGLWLLAALSTPALEHRWGWPGLRAGLTATVLLQALVAILCLAAVWPPSRVGAVALGLVVGGLFAEYVGVKTGLLFGPYAYTLRLQPQVGGVPILVAIAYVGVLVPAWGVADRFVGGSRGPAYVLVAALAATAWDLLLDPILVSRQLWRWRTQGGYFGIPWRNFLGWLCVHTALTLVLRPGRLEPDPLILLYTMAWLTEVVALALIWRLRPPAVVGGVVMGAIAVGAWLRPFY